MTWKAVSEQLDRDFCRIIISHLKKCGVEIPASMEDGMDYDPYNPASVRASVLRRVRRTLRTPEGASISDPKRFSMSYDYVPNNPTEILEVLRRILKTPEGHSILKHADHVMDLFIDMADALNERKHRYDPRDWIEEAVEIANRPARNGGNV